ncbi:class 1 fructose-bisphosphatase [Propionivibrio limicola]|uniref:class 1 fructose-bisphosphatase n=1 Tax=Propionivibrio limicola TaxID=167645 RepID=UPI001290DACE|nr:class 1 fructose-bisphosphatase [Propionivibrio limicola]
MLLGRTNVNKFLIEEQRRNPMLEGDFSMLVSDIVRSCKAISQAVSRGILSSHSFATPTPLEAIPKTLKSLAEQTIIQHCAWGGHVAAMSSADLDDIFVASEAGQRGKYLLVFDPLDGATNLDVNLSVGTIFSILYCPEEDAPVSAADFFQTGSHQVAAGYALYGSSTMLVLTVGTGTHGFTLDREIGEFLLTHPNLQAPADTQIFSINASKNRFWEPPIRRYVEECLDGQTGVRHKDFNMRWAASMVADVHRLLIRGGVFICPRINADLGDPGRIALLHKANPMAMLVEQAGGLASTGYDPVVDVKPESLHQRVPAILGSRNEVERINRYHVEYQNGEDKPFTSPLFGTRSLFRIE